MHKIADIGEAEDRIEAGVGLLLAQAQQCRIQIDVLETGELRVETAAQFQQGRHTPLNRHRAAGGGEGAAEQLQQGAFAGAVAAHHAHGLARFQLEAHIPEGPERRIEGAASAPETLGQAGPRRGEHPVALAELLGLDGDGVSHGFEVSSHHIREATACLLEHPEAHLAHHHAQRYAKAEIEG